ncbi:MAG: DUF4097 family beta strand repeat-containing protein [Acholeplasmataceae bacterium]
MKSTFRVVILVLGFGMLLIAVVIATGASLKSVFGFSNEDARYGELQTHGVTQEIDTIEIDATERDLSVVLTDDEDPYVTYHEHADDTWVIREKDGVLRVEQNRRNRFRIFKAGFASRELRELKIYLPREGEFSLNLRTRVGMIELAFTEVVAFEDLEVRSSTGRIELKNIETESDVRARTQTGRIELESITCSNLEVLVATGDIDIESITAESADLNSSTGRIRMRDSAITEEVFASNSVGDVEMTRVTASVFDLESSTGSIEVVMDPDLSIEFDLKTNLGEVEVFGQVLGKRYITNTGDVRIKASVSTGSIRIKAA